MPSACRQPSRWSSLWDRHVHAVGRLRPAGSQLLACQLPRAHHSSSGPDDCARADVLCAATSRPRDVSRLHAAHGDAGPAMSERGQALIEFSFTVGLLMLLVVATAQVAIFLNYRSSPDLATRERAYQASLVAHQTRDRALERQTLGAKRDPGAKPVEVSVTREGNMIVVTASTYAPAILPIPFPPF